MENISYAKKITSSTDPLFNFTDPVVWTTKVMDDVKDKTGYVMNKQQVNTLKSALNYRITKSYEDDFAGKIFNKYNGIYEILFTDGSVYYIHISNEPSHILRRTTGRQGYSCEHMDNDAWLGPFHDISLMNPTAYLLNEEGDFLGRLNVRWATDDKDNVVIGVDPNVYPVMFPKGSRPDNLFKEALYYILKEDMNYTNARTPYLYKGHSDTTSVYPNVVLPYEGYNTLMQKIQYIPYNDEEDNVMEIYFDDYWDWY